MKKQKNIGIQMTGKALLFINGLPPHELPEPKDYSLVACSDGAFHYLKEKNFPLDQLDFVSGDFDSHAGSDENLYAEKFIYTPDQGKTDFQKSLEIIVARGCSQVDVYGGSGGEMDHFLGNLTVAFRFKEVLEITFYDETSRYFFAPHHLVLDGVKDHLISLYPFPRATLVVSQGLNWPLEGLDLDVTTAIGTRNFAKEDRVSIRFQHGALIVFVGKECRS